MPEYAAQNVDCVVCEIDPDVATAEGAAEAFLVAAVLPTFAVYPCYGGCGSACVESET